MQLCKLSSHECKPHIGTNIAQYTLTEYLGSGMYARVMGTGGGFAIKIYKYNANVNDYFTNEVRALKLFRECPYIAHIYDYGCDMDVNAILRPYIVLHKYAMSVSELIARTYESDKIPAPLNRDIIVSIMTNVFAGLEYMHRLDIIHTDIKASNIMLDHTGIHACLVDFSTATSSCELFQKKVGTLQYASPEVFIKCEYDTACDIWSAYIVCFELLTGDLLFDFAEETTICYNTNYESEHSEEHSESEHSESSATSESSTTSDSDIDSENEREEERYYLTLVEMLIGPAPPHIIAAKSDYFFGGSIADPEKLSGITLEDLMYLNYNFDDTPEIAEFIGCGIKWNSRDRISATAALAHPWLQKHENCEL